MNHPILPLTLGLALVASVAQAATFSVTSAVPDDNSNDYASGTMTDGSSSGSWSITTNVGSTQWYNDTGGDKVPTGGASGVAAAFRNDDSSNGYTNASGGNAITTYTDATFDPLSISFSATADVGSQVDNIIFQSTPYDNSTSRDNGNRAQQMLMKFTITWAGDDVATISDPNANLSLGEILEYYGDSTNPQSYTFSGFSGPYGDLGAHLEDAGYESADGKTISSGATIWLAWDANNSQTDWSITLPSGITDVTVEWDDNVAAGRYGGEDIFGPASEFMGFDVTFVPEPSSAMALCLGAMGFVLRRRR
ncbi:PEP-CTERM sorting domain-containing protein [Persicirhabdus sediminis]|uniref:PEP-CTERM sorting domain-containing protein n=1 Tax=Persicirhabdus sediminis TaxID=454144 RepID=A0A8J7MI47_9BACT|nr:PEP-CTERM sorting domain-containing protein [Persicirhabdus sediminis]MBK1792409.1 PEP-CTERM sorting domain-containing protein [Persicirhabdus sediminis]